MSKLVNRAWTMPTLLLSALTMASPAALASAFAVREQSITYLGNAYAGTSSAVQDASTSYYNPAGLVFLGKNQGVISGAYNHSDIKLSNAYGTDSAGDILTSPTTTKPLAHTFVPGFNGALQVNKYFAFGFSLVELFASNITYDSNSIARYMGSTTKLSTIDISPSIGIKLHNKFYVGAALDVMKINMNLSSGVAWGNTGTESLGFVDNTMHGWATGYHVGVLYKPTKKLRMGLVYFSEFTPHLSGATTSAETLNFGTPNHVTTKMTLPDRVNFSLTATLTKKITGMAEVEWTQWSKLKTLTLNYNSIALPGTLVFDFNNTWRFSLGGDYNFTKALALKAGFCYDQTPVNNLHQSIRVPETDQYILALGLSYKLGKYFSVVGGYSHTFMRTFTIFETASTESLNSSPHVPNAATLGGNIKNYADVVGLQLVFNFK